MKKKLFLNHIAIKKLNKRIHNTFPYIEMDVFGSHQFTSKRNNL